MPGRGQHRSCSGIQHHSLRSAQARLAIQTAVTPLSLGSSACGLLQIADHRPRPAPRDRCGTLHVLSGGAWIDHGPGKITAFEWDEWAALEGGMARGRWGQDPVTLGRPPSVGVHTRELPLAGDPVLRTVCSSMPSRIRSRDLALPDIASFTRCGRRPGGGGNARSLPRLVERVPSPAQRNQSARKGVAAEH